MAFYFYKEEADLIGGKYILPNKRVFDSYRVIKYKKRLYPLAGQILVDGLRHDPYTILRGYSLYNLPEKIEIDEEVRINHYSTSAVEKFKDKNYGALFMDMGTGKTKTILDIYKSKGLDILIVYVCPASLVNNTRKEIFKWESNLKIEFFSCEGIGRSDRIMMKLDKTLRDEDCFLIIDESIKFKNLESNRVKRLLSIAHLAKYRFILNGTPITRSILDLLAQMNILDKKILGMDEAEFARKFLEYKIDGSYYPWRSWSKPHNEEALMNKIAPYVFEMQFEFKRNENKKELFFKLSSDEKMAYDNYKREVLESMLFELDFFSVSQKFQKFYTINREKISFIRDQLKLDDTLFFVKYLDWIKIFHEIDNSIGVYCGEIKDELDEYRNAVLTYGCGSFGLNLQRFNRIVFVDSTFDYAHQIQSISRIKRRGQLRDIEIMYLNTETNLEKLISKSLEKKDGSLNHIKTILRNMTKEELLCL